LRKSVKVLLFLVCINTWTLSYASTSVRIPLHATYVVLEPNKLQDISSLWVSRQINCQLVRMHRRVPILEAARSLKYISPLVLSIKLKQNISFSDGAYLTAQDVVATFNYLHNKGTEFRNVFDWIESIKANGKFDVIIKLKKQTPDFITALSAPHYAIFKKSFIENANLNPTLWKKPIGCGGYKVKENNQNHVTLTPIDKGLPIIFTFQPNNQVPIQEAKKYDLIQMKIIGDPKKVGNFHTVQVFDPVQFYFAFNTRLPIWQNKRNRCAVFSRINPDTVIKKYDNKAKVAENLIPSGVLGYSSNKSYMSDFWVKYVATPIPKKRDFCASLLATSVEKNYRTEYLNMVKQIYPHATLKTINNCSNMNQVIEQQKCDGSIFAVKSNYLDAYEYMQELSTIKGINPTGYHNKKLITSITDSQMKLTTKQKAKAYRKIIKHINDLCLMYPLFTIPYDTVFVKNDISTPGLGQEPINEYYLGNVSYNQTSKINNHGNIQ